MAPKRKRSTPSTTPPKSKKAKPSTTPSPSTTSKPRRRGPPIHPEAPTRYRANATVPLLRLPPELRNYIWTLLYGSHTLHPEPAWTLTSASREIHPLQFTICTSPHTPRDIYALSLLGAAPDDPHRWAAHELNSHRFCDPSAKSQHFQRYDVARDRVQMQHLRVPIVCRQMWDEVSEVVYRTCTFAFSHAYNLLYFLGCRKAGLARVQHVLLVPELGAPQKWGSFAPGELRWFSLKRLSGLRELDLWVRWRGGRDGEGLGLEGLGGGEWLGRKGVSGKLGALQGMVKELRRWDLEDERTRVVVDARGNRKMDWQAPEFEINVPIAERLELARQIKRFLVEGEPKKVGVKGMKIE